MTRIHIDLPDATAHAAQAAGLLAPDALNQLLSEALKSRSLDRLDAARQKLVLDPLPPMSEDEIQTEIAAYRAEKRAATRS
jgi:hypothetical protein